jgi:hypothetical protein
MKKIITLLLLLNALFANAQPYFVDTLNTLPVLLSTPMASVFELDNNQGYAVSTFANYNFNLIYTDINGQRTGQKTWNVFDTLVCSFFTRNATKMPNGNYAVAVLLKNPTTPVYYGGIIMMNSTLTDTLWTKKYTYAVPNNTVSGVNLFYLDTAPNGTLWVAGSVVLNNATLPLMLLHLDANGNIISQNHYPLLDYYNYPYHILATPDGGCIVGLIEKQSSSTTTYQASFVKVNASGQQVWYKQYGNAMYRDDSPISTKAQSPNEYWLIYHAGRTGSTVPSGEVKAIRVNNVGTELEIKYLTTYIFNQTRPINIYDALQDLNGDITLAVNYSVLGSNGHLWKFNSNLDSLWRKQISVPNYNASEELLPLDLIRANNGDYICAGMHVVSAGNDAIFLSRLDSMGCLVVGTEESPSPSRAGENIRIYPNPASDYINVDFLTENPQGRLYVYNAQGILITQINLLEHNTVISTTDWAVGGYFYEYTIDGVVAQRGKLQVIR